MAGIYVRKVLAFIQMPNSKGDIFVPGGTANGLVHIIMLHNINTTTETIVLNYHDGTNEYEIYKEDILANDTVVIPFANEGFVVMNAGKITGNTTTASKVTIYISGSEET
jgi:hypothetical protein